MPPVDQGSTRSPECPKSVSVIQADAAVWHEVCEILDNPAVLLSQAQKDIKELYKNAGRLHRDRELLEKEIQSMTQDRQWIAAQAQQGRITPADVQHQLGTLRVQEADLNRELSALGHTPSINALNNWEVLAKQYLMGLQEDVRGIKQSIPHTEEERLEIFHRKRRIVNSLVEKVTINRERKLKVEIRLKLPEVLSLDPKEGDHLDSVP